MMTGFYAVLRLPREMPRSGTRFTEQWYGPLATIQNGGDLNILTLQVKIHPDRLQMQNIAFVRKGQLIYYTDGKVQVMFYVYQPSINPSKILISRLCAELSCNRHWHLVPGRLVPDRLFRTSVP